MLGKTVFSVGFIMSIPGIDNMDTYRYIKKAIPQRFHSFSLANLANSLELPSRKM